MYLKRGGESFRKESNGLVVNLRFLNRKALPQVQIVQKVKLMVSTDHRCNGEGWRLRVKSQPHFSSALGQHAPSGLRRKGFPTESVINAAADISISLFA